MGPRYEIICHIKRKNSKEDVLLLHDLPEVRQSLRQELRGYSGRDMKLGPLDFSAESHRRAALPVAKKHSQTCLLQLKPGAST